MRTIEATSLSIATLWPAAMACGYGVVGGGLGLMSQHCLPDPFCGQQYCPRPKSWNRTKLEYLILKSFEVIEFQFKALKVPENQVYQEDLNS